MYDKDFDGFLNNAMKEINKMSDHERAYLQQQFERAMVIARELFGKDAFRKRYKVGAPRQPINKPLFETWTVNFNQLSDQQVEKMKARKDELLSKFIGLINSPDPHFNEAVSFATGDPKKVRLRFEAIGQLIKDVLS